MAFQGSLKELRLGDVLQTVLSIGHRGLLRVRRGGNRSVLFVSPEAIRLLEPVVLDDEVVLQAFVERGLVSAANAERARAGKAKGETGLQVLEREKGLPPGLVDGLFSAEAEDHILSLLTWTEGEFRFEESAEQPSTKSRAASASFDPNRLLLAAAQRQDERREIDTAIGPEAVLLIPTGASAPAPEGDDDPTARVLARLDGKTLLDAIALREAIGIFAARKAVLRLVQAKAARLARTDELKSLSLLKAAAGDLYGAAALYRQWHAVTPEDPTPLVALATMAGQAGRVEEEADALRTLAKIYLGAKEFAEAKGAYERILAQRPADREALEGLRETAKLAEDSDGYAAATRRLAEQVLEAGDAGQASSILNELLDVAPLDVEAHVLKLKAVVRLSDREQAVTEIERILTLLPRRCRTKTHREIAQYVRVTAANVAPERADILRKLRTRIEAGEKTRRRAVMLAALVAVLGTAGFVLWPESPRGLLDKAKEAVAAGDRVTAFARIADLADRFPEASETTEAMKLRDILMNAQNLKPPPGVDEKARADVRAKADKARAAFSSWPDPKAVALLEALTAGLDASNAPVLRHEVTKGFKDALVATLGMLRNEALVRRDALDAAAWAAAKPPSDLVNFRDLVKSAERALDPDWLSGAIAAIKAARKAIFAIGDPALGEPIRGLESDLDAAVKAADRRAKDVAAAGRELRRAEIEDAYEKARRDAPRPLAQGRLDEAEAYYMRLRDLVESVQNDVSMSTVRDLIERRGIRDFALAKVDMIGRIRKGLAAASAAEGAGDLGAAAATYGSLVHDFELIRFDDVFTVPLRIRTVPVGARVSINGKEVGPSPVVVRYGWGSQSVVTVEMNGYQTGTLLLKTADPKPPGEITVGLSPAARWSKEFEGVVEAPPLGIEGDVVTASRRGRVERRSKESGEVLWAVDLERLEGVRGRMVLEASSIWVALIDGHIARLSPTDGTLLAKLDLPGRPIGDVAAVKDSGVVGIPTDRSLVMVRGREITSVPHETPITAGAIAAHGAFWVGDAHGSILRVALNATKGDVVPLGGKDAVIGLAAASCGVLALTADGAIALVNPEGTHVVWRRQNLGEAVGSPAVASGVVATADRGGRVHLFLACDGQPLGTKDVGAEARSGLLTVGDRIAASLSDGRLWVLDPKSGDVVVDVALRADSRRPATDLGDGAIALPVGTSSILVVPLPKR